MNVKETTTTPSIKIEEKESETEMCPYRQENHPSPRALEIVLVLADRRTIMKGNDSLI
jgi:hypothetical protein